MTLTSADDELRPGPLAASLRRRWWLVVLVGLIGALVGLASSVLRTDTYLAERRLVLVAASAATSADDANSASMLAERQLRTYAQAGTTALVLQPVIDRLQLQTTPDDLAQSVDISSPTGTVMLDVAVTASSPQDAARIANAVGDQLVTAVNTLSPTGASGKIVRAQALDEARPPAQPTRTLSGFVKPVAAGAAVGLLVGLLIAVAVGGRSPSRSSTHARSRRPRR